MNKSLAERAAEARKNANLNQTEAGKKIGISRAAISQWENGATKSISSTLLHKAARVYGVSAEWLATGKGVMVAATQIREVSPTYEKRNTVKVDLLTAKAGMGALVSTDLDHDSTITTVELTKQFIASQLGSVSNPKNLALISGIGDSMEGVFDSGDTLFIDTGIERFITEGIYFVQYDGSNWIKRVQRNGNGGYTLKSSNPEYDPITVKKNRVSELRIIGVVVGVLNFKKLV